MSLLNGAGLLSGVVLLWVLVYLVHSLIQEHRSDRIPALLYHRFLAADRVERNPIKTLDLRYTTDAVDFEKQMAHLRAAGYATISMDEFLSFRDGKTSLPPRPILITCDDGFESIYRHAFPVWKRYGMKATVFMTADRGSKNFFKHAVLDAPLTPEQLAEMSACGISIHSHGMSHEYLSELPDQVVRWELEASRRSLEAITGKPVRYFAAPGGAYDRRVRKLVETTGYRAAFCMLKGTNNGTNDLYFLRRLVVGRGLNLEDFKRLLTPRTGCLLRLVSAGHDLLMKGLGPYRFDTLQNRLEKVGVLRLLAPGALRFAVAGTLLLLMLFASLVLVDLLD